MKYNLRYQHDDRYDMAEEYVKVAYKLWESSWRSDAVVLDKERGIYTDPSRIREINHEGKYFNVPGPHICQPSRQRTPVILQAGTSKAGKTFASQHAEAIFVAGMSPASIAKNIAEIRETAKMQFGRDPQSIKFLALLCPVLGQTEEEAWEKFRYYRSLGSIDGALALFGGWTGIDLDQYGEDEELRHVQSNAIRYVLDCPLGKFKLRQPVPLPMAGPRPVPARAHGLNLPLESTSPLEDSAQRQWAPRHKSQMKWSAGFGKLTSMDSTW